MKHKLLTFALMGAFASTMLFSCKNAEEPNPVSMTENNRDLVEYIFTVTIPDEMKTRAYAYHNGIEGHYGESGLIEFDNRNINRLWYGVYYDEEFVKKGTVTRSNTSPFVLQLSMPGDIYSDPSKLSLFFWADNSGDSYTVTPPNTLHSNWGTVLLNFEEKYVGVRSNTMHCGDEFYFHDCFAKYFKFTDNPNQKDRTATVTLKRPFALFHVLTDDFFETDIVNSDKISSITSFMGFSDGTNWVKCPNVWNFMDKDDEFSYSDEINDGGQFYFVNFFNNSNNRHSTIFKDRQMDYIACYFTLAPTLESILKIDGKEQDYLSLNYSYAYTAGGSTSRKFLHLPLPDKGIQANRQYVYYNKPRSEGGNGFMNPENYLLTVEPDEIWEEEISEEEIERLLNN